MAMKTFTGACFLAFLMMAVSSGLADPGSASDSPQNYNTYAINGNAGYIEEFTGNAIEEVLNKYFMQAPAPQISGGADIELPEDYVFPTVEVANVITDDFSGGAQAASFNNADEFIPNQSAPIPEPGTLLLFGSGILGLAILGRRKLNK